MSRLQMLELDTEDREVGHSIGDRGMIRVMLVISNLEYGGAQRQVVELANNMDTSRFIVHVCSLSAYVPLANQLTDSVERLHIIKKHYKYDFYVALRLARLLRQFKIDVVQGYLFDAEIASFLAGWLAKTPVVVGSERNTNYYIKRIQRIVYRLTLRLADCIIANSNSGADFNSRMLGYDPSRYRVVHNGVDIQRFAPRSGVDVRKKLGIGNDEKVVGMFASFKQQKNHPLFFKAARQVLDKMPDTRILLVGDMLYAGMHGSRDYYVKMQRMLDALSLRDRCILLGNRDDVAELYSACDITVLTSFFEGTPNVLLESMACGVPVIATDVSDNKKIVQHGVTGYIIPLDGDVKLAQLICDLLLNGNKLINMGQAARKWVSSEFSTSRLACKTEKVYLELLSSGCLKGKLKVVIATHFPSDPALPSGGVESVSVNLVRALSKFDDIELHVVTNSNNSSLLAITKWKGVTIHRLPRNKGGVLWNAVGPGRRQVSCYIKNLAPDVVHAHDTYGLMVKGLPIPRVFTIHGFIYGDTLVSGGRGAWLRSKIWRQVETRGWSDHPYIISISPYVRERLAGIAKGVIYDIDNPVAESYFKITRKNTKKIIFSAAVISPRKNTVTLIEAFARVVADGCDAVLRLAGAVTDPGYGRSVRKLIRHYRLEDRVTILGGVSTEQVIEELSGASIFALVSLEENSPMGIEEAMAAGVPVVTSNRCGMPYMISHGESGFLVDPLDVNDIARRLRQLLENDALRETMGEKSQKITLDRFHPDAVACRTRDVYYEAFNTRRFLKGI